MCVQPKSLIKGAKLEK